MQESKIALTERLRQEGRWEEASKFKDEAIKTRRAKGMKKSEASEAAWEAMAEAFPPVAAPPLSAVLCADDSSSTTSAPPIATREPTHWEILQWVADALGRLEKGEKIQVADAPNKAAIGLLNWALRDKDSFYTLWASEGRRHDGGPVKTTTRRTIPAEKIDSLLDDVLDEAKEIEREAMAKFGI